MSLGKEKTDRSVVVRSVSLLFLVLFIDVVGIYAIVMALPSIASDLQLNSVQIGALVSVYFFSFAIMQAPGGALADRIGAKKLITISLVMWSVLMLLTGFVKGYLMLLIVRGLMGVFQGPLMPSIMKAVGERVKEDKRATSYAVISSAEPFSLVVTPLVAGLLIAAVGWHQMFYLLGVLGLILAPIIWFTLPQPTLLTPSKPIAPTAPGPNEKLGQRGIGLLLKNRLVWVLTLMMFGLGIAIMGMTAWIPSYLTTEKELDIATAGILASIPLVFSIAGNILGGWLYDRYFRGRFRLLVLPAVALSAIFLVLMGTSDSVNQFIIYESIAFFTLYIGFQPILGVTMRALPSQMLGLGSGIILSGTKVAGMITPLVMGGLINAFSYQAAFGFLVFGAVIATIVSFWVRDPKSGHDGKETSYE